MRSVLCALVSVFVLSPVWADTTCHPSVDMTKAQFGVGYGSLMERASRTRTAPNTGEAMPAIVTGFERSFSSPGSPVGFSTTYLGVQTSPDEEMTAAVYRIYEAADIKATDARERGYCRVGVDPAEIRLLDGSDVINDGQYWIYVNKPERRAYATERLPLVQSYIDIFVTGCQQLSQSAIKFDGDFVAACILTTKGWSEHWVNDRIYPRRPFIYQPNAGSIDRVLQQHVPQFESIRIE